MSTISFGLEIYPPKTSNGEESLLEYLDDLNEYSPKYISVTHGAGGSGNRNHTQDLCEKINARYEDVSIAAHVTCVGSSKAEILSNAKSYSQNGINDIVAIRGDKLDGDDASSNNASNHNGDEYVYTLDMLKDLLTIHDFNIAVAAYAEGHPEAPSLDLDLRYLKKKMDEGATSAITQFFFDPEVFLRFRDRAVKKGVTIPIIPGLLPILDFPRTLAFANKCGATVPNFLAKMFEGFDKSTQDHKLLAMNVLSHQVTRLIDEDIMDFHFYTLNEKILTKHLCHWLRVAF